MDEKEIKFIQDQIGYTFKNQELLVQAFTRRSYSMDRIMRSLNLSETRHWILLS